MIAGSSPFVIVADGHRYQPVCHRRPQPMYATPHRLSEVCGATDYNATRFSRAPIAIPDTNDKIVPAQHRTMSNRSHPITPPGPVAGRSRGCWAGRTIVDFRGLGTPGGPNKLFKHMRGEAPNILGWVLGPPERNTTVDFNRSAEIHCTLSHRRCSHARPRGSWPR